jgi:hypothetical protein
MAARKSRYGNQIIMHRDVQCTLNHPMHIG